MNVPRPLTDQEWGIMRDEALEGRLNQGLYYLPRHALKVMYVTQGNFTACILSIHAQGEERPEGVCLGVTKRNPEDPNVQERAERISFYRAIR